MSADFTFSAAAAFAISANCAVQSWPLRLSSVTRLRSTRQPIRYPSYFSSCTHSGPDGGFVMRLEDLHWLAKGFIGDKFVDLIYGMGNAVAFIDADWFSCSRPGILAAQPVRIAPSEELIWHRLFINERHRHDMSDIL